MDQPRQGQLLGREQFAQIGHCTQHDFRAFFLLFPLIGDVMSIFSSIVLEVKDVDEY